jgi:hypothetical protein
MAPNVSGLLATTTVAVGAVALDDWEWLSSQLRTKNAAIPPIAMAMNNIITLFFPNSLLSRYAEIEQTRGIE